MLRVNMLIAMTAVALVSVGSSRGSTTPKPLIPDSVAVSASMQSSLPMMKGEKSLSKTILPPASTVNQLLVAATADDGGQNPPPRSTHCPPGKDDQHKTGYLENEQNGGDNQGNDNKDKDKDKDRHDDCGKGDDGKNP